MNPVWPSWQEVATKPALTSNLFTWEAAGSCFKIDQRFLLLKKKKNQTHQPFSKNTFETARVLSKRYKRPLCLCFSAMVCWLLFFLNDGEEKNIMLNLLSPHKVVAAIIKHTHCVISKHKWAHGQTFFRLPPLFFFPL